MPKQPNRTPDWESVRSLFTLDDRIAFFNNGTAGPASKRVSETRAHYDAEIARPPLRPVPVRQGRRSAGQPGGVLRTRVRTRVFFTRQAQPKE